MSENDWIEWNGGECPVEPGAQIQVKFRGFGGGTDYANLKKNPPAPAGEFRWSYKLGGRSGDIIAYHLVKP